MKTRVLLSAIVLAFLGCDGFDPSSSSSSSTNRLDFSAAEHASVKTPSTDARLILSFNEDAGELPEGIAVNKTGAIFISIAPLAQLWRVGPKNPNPVLFGSVAGVDASAGDLGMLGLAIDGPGNVYAGVQSSNPDANGVWVFDRKTGDPHRIEGSEAIALANDLAFDKRGNLYITDSILGAIWRVPKHGSLEPWLVGDENLAGTGALGLPVPVGANGIEYRQGTLYVANTEKALIVQVPVGSDGSPGVSSILTEFPAVEIAPGVFFPGVPDGLALDVHGNIFVAQINFSAVSRVTPAGEVSEVYSGDPLDWPSSIAFGTSRGQQKTLFAVNFSIGEANGDLVERMGPGLVAMNVGVPGMPLP